MFQQKDNMGNRYSNRIIRKKNYVFTKSVRNSNPWNCSSSRKQERLRSNCICILLLDLRVCNMNLWVNMALFFNPFIPCWSSYAPLLCRVRFGNYIGATKYKGWEYCEFLIVVFHFQHTRANGMVYFRQYEVMILCSE